MLARYKKVSNMAAGAAVVAIATAIALGRHSSDGNIWGPGGAPSVLVYIFSAAVFTSFWAYAKAKGRSGWLGLLLPFLSIIGLIILLYLEDLSDRVSDVKCEKCGGVNFGEDAICRYCRHSLVNASEPDAALGATTAGQRSR